MGHSEYDPVCRERQTTSSPSWAGGHPGTYRWSTSAPTEGGRDVRENRLDNMCIVGDAQLIRDRQQQRVGLGDGLVPPELLNEDVRLSGIATTEDCSRLLVDKADLVLFLAPASEVGAIAIVHQREDAAADRDTRFGRMAGLLPGDAESPDLRGLLDVERLSGLVVL